MGMLDAFNSDNFNMVSLTTAIEKTLFVPSRLGQMGLFTPKPISTLTAVVEERAGILRLLPTKRRGEPASVGKTGKRTVRSFEVPHIPHEDTVWADDVIGVRAFDTESQESVFMQVVNDKLATMKQNFELTWEWHRAGAVTGKVLDADGSILFNLFTEFDVSETSVDFVLGTDATKIKNKCTEVIRAIKTALGGIPFSGVVGLAGDTWWDKFTSHPLVETAWGRWNDGEFLRQSGLLGFPFAGIQFENYTNPSGDKDFIPANGCRFFPVGVPNGFQVIHAPANFSEAVGTLGKPLYVKQRMLDLDVGVRLHGQSNPLFMCNLPATLIKGTTSN